ncbi:hypothetical protein CFOL_v3_10858 [Cephalotus follicularis]|uniref:Uncharacterized protein n=1 Tax=Cephalotus follicularis TaxID=3775 RepID=A0A1Q3BHM6_CEPFO|nr:hypothetical protein CFOL_v3_10858 [Cephalotus follicularis]
MATVSWKERFSNMVVKHLPRTHSDHHLILLDVFGVAPLPKVTRRLEFWLPGFLIQTFLPSSSLLGSHHSVVKAVAALGNATKTWNREVYGNIFHLKKRLLDRLNGIQFYLSNQNSSFLINLENELMLDYNEVLKHEELL